MHEQERDRDPYTEKDGEGPEHTDFRGAKDTGGVRCSLICPRTVNCNIAVETEEIKAKVEERIAGARVRNWPDDQG